MPEVGMPDEPCRPVRTIYDTFADLLADIHSVDDAIEQTRKDFLTVREDDLSRDLGAAKQAVGGSIHDHLPGSFGKSIERQITASFEYLRHLASLIEEVGTSLGAGFLDGVIRTWNRYLAEAMAERVTIRDRKSVLVAFSVVEDQTIDLASPVGNRPPGSSREEIHRLRDEVIERASGESGMDEAQILAEALRRADMHQNGTGGDLDKAVHDCIDLLACVCALMRREGLKPTVIPSALQQWLVDYFAAANPPATRTFGGAAGNEAFVLRSLGLPVLLHAPYHHSSQAEIAPECARRVAFDENGLIQPFPSLSQGEDDDARRLGGVYQLTPTLDSAGRIVGPALDMGTEVLKPIRADRIVLKIPNPRNDSLGTWSTLRVCWAESSWNGAVSGARWDDPRQRWFLEIDRHDLKGLGEDDWPYFPLFQHRPQLDGETVVVELASAGEMTTLASHVQIVLLGGLQELCKEVYNNPKLTVVLREALVVQLRQLRQSRVSLYLEVSGVESKEALVELQDLLARAGIKNISLNREELVQMTSQFGSPCFTSPRAAVPETPIGIYVRAVELLRYLALDTVYVHDLELDLLVRRDGDDEDVARSKLQRGRQAMLLSKAAVPAAIIQRAGQTQSWTPVLSSESLAALVAFAADYSALVAAKVKGVDREDVRRMILTKGHYHPGESGISVAVAPTISVDLPASVSLAGAGDMDFAVYAAAVG